MDTTTGTPEAPETITLTVDTLKALFDEATGDAKQEGYDDWIGVPEGMANWNHFIAAAREASEKGL